MVKSDNQLGPAPEEVTKIGSLLRVFTTVVKSMGPDFDASSSVELSLNYLLEVKIFCIFLKSFSHFKLINYLYCYLI